MNPGILTSGYRPPPMPYPLLGRPTPVPAIDFRTPLDPRSISGLGLWLDATVASSWTLQTGVSEWRDLSGNGRHFSQTIANNQPTLTDGDGNPAQINGRRAFYSDGTNDILNGNAAAASLIRNIAGVTVFTVTNYQTASAVAGDLVTYFGGASLIASPAMWVYVQRGAGDSNAFRSATASGNTRITSIAWNASANTVQGWNNGALLLNAAGSTAGNTSDTNTTLVSIFRASTNPHRAFTSEIIVYRRVLETAERVAVEAYLTRKYIP